MIVVLILSVLYLPCHHHVIIIFTIISVYSAGRLL